MGTWMAPELQSQMHSVARKPAAATDIFSFGMVIYYVLVGRAPQPMETALSKLDGPGLAGKCKMLCEECLQLEPVSRPTIQAVQAQLLECTSANYEHELKSMGW